MSEEQIKEYLLKGGSLFTVVKLDSIRDGGTKVVKTNRSGTLSTGSLDFFIDNLDWTIHNSYPTSDDNLIKDELLKKYIIHVMNVFIEKQKRHIEIYEEWVFKIEKI